MPTAILVDGAFFIRRYLYLRGRARPARVADDLHKMCHQHAAAKQDGPAKRLYRIFYYDCPPLTKKAHNPITKRSIDFSKTDTAIWRLAFHDALKRKRKVALRLGYLNEDSAKWVIREERTKQLLAKRTSVDELVADDVVYEAKQKGVDMRIGIDIASMAFKKQVDQIVLIAGDSDFVPAAKLARREGIDFVLDPMWAPIKPDLYEHIDGLRSFMRRDQSYSVMADTITAEPPNEPTNSSAVANDGDSGGGTSLDSPSQAPE